MIAASKARRTAPPESPESPRDAIRALALAQGFDAVGFTAAELAPEAGRDLAEYVARGLHGDMGWLARDAGKRAQPAHMWPGARSAVILGLSYAPARDPLDALEDPSRGAISVYAQSRDYHRVLKKRLKVIARFIAGTYGAEAKVFVDTAPLMEKPLAAKTPVGWQGKHTNLVSRRHGSWLFLGEILTDLDLGADAAEDDHCGSCRACLDVCPTNAFLGPYKLDARRCISYLTIEHEGHIPREFREAMGNRIYGCDDCLAVCPWNKFADTAHEPELAPREELDAPKLVELAALDDAAFRRMFSGTTIKRSGRDRFVRNVLIAVGNSNDPQAAAAAEARLEDSSPLVRAMAVWALSRLLPRADFDSLRARCLAHETDSQVREEWAAADATA